LRNQILQYAGLDRDINGLRKSPIIKNKCTRLSVDRVDNNQGYTASNIRKCCHICNITKGSFITHGEMKVIGPSLRKRIEDKLGKK
jgi:hypothetical protein